MHRRFGKIAREMKGAFADEVRGQLERAVRRGDRGARGPALTIKGRPFIALTLAKKALRSMVGRKQEPRLPRLVVVNTFNCWPPHGGGQIRILNFYKTLSERADITLVSLAPSSCAYRTLVFNENFREFVIPATRKQYSWEAKLQEALGVYATDIAAIDNLSLTPDFATVLRLALHDADIAVAEHPYCFRTLRQVWKGRVIYHAHNVEYVLKSAILPKTEAGDRALAAVASVEKECCAAADRIFAVSKSDVDALNELYGAPKERMFVVPNGMTVSDARDLSHVEREQNKRALGLSGRVAVYVGSMHPPNVEGALALLDIARKCPNWLIVFVGSMCDSPRVRQAAQPQNTLMLGCLSEQELDRLLCAADLGLNPIVSGSGSNLKMLTYMKSRLPTLTTPMGNRGYEFGRGQCFVANIEDFPSELDAIARMDATSLSSIASNGYEAAVARFQWKDIVQHALLEFEGT
jgi:glycosyltransferase involved in cell wall biosynthesis